ncbi:glyoxalase [Leptospira ognonensis]|uniref:Glyoxalase n=1 Tax=Leptospira ognonensis TaxID=2484945 RepID=A0A4R9K1Z7_9LEPT|nr:VOC family protein [Leptospira ognonensis]TGL59749.1 glyoxalase [Leptospira ognonensis]
MIKNTRHTGIVVRDLDRAFRFYEALGFKLWKREVESGDFISTVVGIENVKVETAKLKAPDNSMLELLQYHSHPKEKEIVNAPSNQLGCSHIAFSVIDIDKTCDFILQQGGSLVNPPALSANGLVKVAYCHDPEGVLLELVEEIM